MRLVWELMSEEGDGLYSNVAKVRWMGGDGGWMGQKSVDVLQSGLDGESSSSGWQEQAVGIRRPATRQQAQTRGASLWRLGG